MRLLGFSARLALAAAVVCPAVRGAAPADAEGFERPHPTVIDGAPTTISAWPWMAIVNEERGGLLGTCGGTVLSARWVLTAAHCFENAMPAGHVEVGSTTRGAGTEIAYDVVRIHEDYDEATLENDIALVHLTADVPVGVGFVTLADAGVQTGLVTPGATGTVLGWGITSRDASSTVADVLQQGEIEIREDTACEVFGSDWNPATQICAGDPAAGANICGGDSGGPLLVDDGSTHHQVGVASYTRSGCEAPGVYTKVASYGGWIATAMAAPLSTLSIGTAGSVDEGALGETATLAFPVTRTGIPDGPSSVEWDVTGGTALSGDDYTGVTSGTLTFSDQATSSTIALTVSGDNYAEGHETVEITLSNAVGAGIGTATATGTILNDDRSVFSVIGAEVTELDANTYTECGLALEGALEVAVLVDYEIGGGASTAVSGEDYSASRLLVGNIRFNARTTTTSENIRTGFNILADDIPEPEETIECSFSNPRAEGDPLEGVIFDLPPEPAVITIADDDEATVSIGSTSTTEGGPGSTAELVFPVTLDVPTYLEATVDYAVGGGTASEDVDYEGVGAGTLVFNPGDTQAFVRVTVNGDNLNEGDETVLVTLSNAVDAVLGTAEGTGTIVNDDAPLVSVSPSEDLDEGGNGDSVPVAFTVTLDNPSDAEVTVEYAVGGTATNGVDYTGAVSGTVVFSPGDISETVGLSVLGDQTIELSETIILTLSGPTGNAEIDVAEATILIRNDDFPTVSIGSSEDTEGDSGSKQFHFPVTITPPPLEEVTVRYAVTGGSAVSGEDYQAFPENATLTVSPGSGSSEIDLLVLGDTLVEPDELVIVTLSEPSGLTIDASTGVVTIRDDDLPVLNVGAATVDEGGPGTTVAMPFEFVLDQEPLELATVGYRRHSGLATPGVDFDTFEEGTLSFIPGQTRQSFSVIVRGDDLAETDESVTLEILNPNGLTIGDSLRTGIIVDDDSPRLSVNSPTVEEGPSGSTRTLDFMVSLVRGGASGITVEYDVAGDGGLQAATSGVDHLGVANASQQPATPGVDYVDVPEGTLTFPAGVESRTVSITVIGDDEVEPNEYVLFTLSNPTGGALLSSDQRQGTGTITNDDVPVASVSVQETIDEGGSSSADPLVFTLTLDKPSHQGVSVAYALGGTAVPGVDYTGDSNGRLYVGIGATTTTHTVFLIGNDEAGPDRTVVMTISDPADVVIGDGTATSTIRDEDPPAVSIASPDPLVEGDTGLQDLVFTVFLDAAVSWDVTVDYAVTGTAAVDIDYEALPNGTLTLEAGATSSEIVVRVIGDTGFESDETVVVTLSNPQDAVLSEAVGTGTIVNDDQPLLAIDSPAVIEGDSGTTALAFTVSLSGASPLMVTADYAVSGTASGGIDYGVPAGSTLTIAPGATTTAIEIVVNGDAVPEPDETVIVTLSNPANAEIGTGTGTGTIRNDDNAFAIDSPSVFEGGSGATTTIVFTVRLDPPAAGEARVRYALQGGTALEPGDFTLPGGELVFGIGDSERTFAAVVNGDDASEPDETVRVALADPVGAVVGTGTGVGTIRNDDNGFSVGPAEADEGDTGTTPLSFSVTLDPVASHETRVDFQTADGSAESGNGDYVHATGSLVFNSGEIEKTVTIFINGDEDYEQDETLFLRLTNAAAAVIASPEGRGTIRDDDIPNLSVDAPRVNEGAEGATSTLVFTFSLSGPGGQDASVDWSVSGESTATAGVDYAATAASGTLTFVSGDTEESVTFIVNGDNVPDGDKTLVVELSNPVKLRIPDAPLRGTGTILDDEVHFTVTPESVAEGEGPPAETLFTVRMDRRLSDTTVLVDYTLGGGESTATAGTDYSEQIFLNYETGGLTGTITYKPESNSAVSSTLFRFTTFTDSLVEGNETVQLVLSNPRTNREGVAFTLPDPALATIVDANQPVVSIDSPSVTEGPANATTTLGFTVSLSGPPGAVVTVDYEAGDGTATAEGNDYVAASGTLAFDVGETEKTIDITVLGDDDLEQDETLSVTLSDPVGLVLGTSTGVGVIEDDDEIFISLSGGDAVEGPAGATTTLVFGVALSGRSQEEVRLDYAVSGGSATVEEDYAPLPGGSLAIAPGATSAAIEVVVRGDDVDEDDETVVLTFTNATGAILDYAEAVGTIRDDEETPLVSISTGFGTASLAAETAGATTGIAFTVALSGLSSWPVTVTYDLGGTATPGLDYEEPPGTLAIAAGTTTAVIGIVIQDDDLVEPGETVVVTLTDATNAAVDSDAATATATIGSDDVPVISAGDAEIVEGDAGSFDLLFPLRLSQSSSQEVSVAFSLITETATPGEDYRNPASPERIVFAAGDSAVLHPVPVLGDLVAEGDETFLLELSDPRNALLGRDRAVGTIRDDDVPVLSLTAGSFVEGSGGAGGAFVIVAAASEALPADATVDWEVTGGTATAGVDYTGATGTLALSAGATSGTVTIAIVGDNESEPDETIEVTFTGAVQASVRAPVVTGTILDDDYSTLEIAGATVVEGATGTTAALAFPVRLEPAADGEVQVGYRVTGGTASAGIDYETPAEGTLVISTGLAMGEVQIVVRGDDVPELHETVVVELMNPSGARILTGTATGTIQNDDTPTLSVLPVSAIEGDAGSSSTLVFRAELDGPVPGEVSADYAVAAGSAEEGVDFLPIAEGQFTFPEGERTAEAEVPVVGDVIDEDDETVSLVLSNPIGVILAVSEVEGTIVDDDTAVASVTAADPSVTEGASGTTTEMGFVLELSTPSARNVLVQYGFEGTAVEGEDYDADAVRERTLDAGTLSAPVSVTVRGDDTLEVDETVVLVIDDVEGAAAGAAAATGTIVNDDFPAISIGDADVDEEVSATDLVLPVRLSEPAPWAVSSGYAVVGGTAMAGMDFAAPPGDAQVSIPMGATSSEIVIRILADTFTEPRETVLVRLSDPQDAVIGDGDAVGTIHDNDPAAVSVLSTSATEGGAGSTTTLVFIVEASARPPYGGTVDYEVVGGTATPGVDYEPLATGTLELAQEGLRSEVTVEVIGDDAPEPDETVILEISDPVEAWILSPRGTGTILDDDLPRVSIDSPEVLEGASGTTAALTFAAVLNAPALEEVSVSYAVTADGTATAGTDFQSVDGILTFGPGATSSTFTVSVTGDDDIELDETVEVRLSSPSGVLIGTGTGVGVIRNDDFPVLSIRGGEVPEGASGTTAQLVFVVLLSATSPAEVRARYDVAEGTARNQDDYILASSTVVFDPGETTKDIVAEVQGDDAYGPDETVTVRLSDPVNALLAANPTEATGTIRNDDSPPVFSIEGGEVAEGDLGTADLGFTIRLRGGTEVPVQVDYGPATGGTATPGVDYEEPGGNVEFDREGDTSIAVAVNGDDVPEGDETLFVRLLDPQGGAVIATGSAVATGVIRDDDPTITALGDSVVEGAVGATTSLVFTLALTVPAGEEVRVDYAVGSGSATEGEDYAAPSGSTAVLAPGSTSTTVEVVVLGDDLDEDDETVPLALSNAVGAVILGANAVGVIEDDEDAPLVSVAAGSGAPAVVPEADAATTGITFTVSLSGPSSWPVSVSYGLGGTATSGLDYEEPPGGLTVPAGATTSALEIAVLDDDRSEPDETVVVTLTDATNAAVDPDADTATATIEDDDVASVSIDGAEVTEGDEGTTDLTFPVRLSLVADVRVDVDYAVTGGTATEGVDFGGATGTVSFAPGARLASISIPVFGDAVDEPDETVVLELRDAVNAVVDTESGTATGTIRDNDVPLVSLVPAGGGSVDEGNAGATTTLAFLVELSTPAVEEVVVHYAVAGGTASAGHDYEEPASGSVVLAPGATSSPVGVTVLGDDLDEDDETVILGITEASGAIPGAAMQATGTIRDDDAPPDVSVGIASPRVAEGAAGATSSLAFAVGLSRPSSKVVTVDYGLGGTAVGGEDYEAPAGTLEIAAGATSAAVAVVVNGDGAVEPDETVVLELTGAENGAIAADGRSATGVIVNDDEPALSIGPAEAVEGAEGATTTLAFPLRLSQAAAVEVTVDYAVTGGTATAGDDYAPPAGTLAVPLGATSGKVLVLVYGDGLVEGDETVEVTLIRADGAVLGQASATGFIRDDDIPVVSLVGGETQEGDGGSISLLVFTASLSQAPVADIRVDYAVAGGTATAGTDFRSASGTLVFGTGQTVRTFPVEVVGDDVLEADETVEAALSGAMGATLGTSTATGVIRNDDEAAFSIGTAEVSEGASGTTAALAFPVTLTPPMPAGTGTVDWRVVAADGTATAGIDFASASGTLSFGQGVGERMVSVVVNGDDTDEFDESVVVELGNPGPGTMLGDARGTGWIRDDDPEPELSLSSAGVDEGDGGTVDLVFDVALSAPSGKTVTVGYRDAGVGTATADEDYDGFAGGTLTFAPGATSGTFAVSVRGDEAFEPDETVVAVLADAVNAAAPTPAAAGTIRNDDPPGFRIRPRDAEEGPGEFLVFEVVPDAPPPDSMTGNYRVRGTTATEGEDFRPVPNGTLTIPAGATSAEVRVEVLPDDLDEIDEAVEFELSGLEGMESDETLVATARILDDDPEPELSLSSAGVDEGDGGTADLVFRAELSAPSGKTVAVGYRDTGLGTATAGEDYDEFAGGTLTFAPGATSGTFAVSVRGDEAFEPDETVVAALADAVNAAVTAAAAAGAIRNDDLPRLLVRSRDAGEGAGEALVFEAVLEGPSPDPVAGDYTVRGGTATAGEDFRPVPDGELAIPVGATSTEVRVEVLPDALDEADETVVFSLSGLEGAGNPAPAPVTAVIRDDDPEPTLSVAAPGAGSELAEGAGGARTAVAFPVALGAVSGRPVEVTYALLGTATAGEDYEAPSGSLVIPAGTTESAVEVVVLGDALREDDETVTVELRTADHAAIQPGARSATATIRNDDDGGIVSVLAINSPAATEGAGGQGTASLAFRVTLTPDAIRDVTVDYAVTGGTASAGIDYDELPPGTLVFARGETEKTLSVRVRDDAEGEDLETVVVTLSGATGGASIGTGVGTGRILDDDGGVVPTLRVVAGEVAEGPARSTTTLSFAATLDVPPVREAAVSWRTEGGSAAAGEDYEAASGRLVFPAGIASGTVEVVVRGDGMREGDETVGVVFTGGEGIAVPGGALSVAGVIREDDPVPEMGIVGAGMVPEGPQGARTPASFVVRVSGPSAAPVTADFSVREGTATAGVDFIAASGTLVVPAGATSTAVEVVILGDDDFEPDETFFVDVRDPEGASVPPSGTLGVLVDGGVMSAMGMIGNDDTPVVAVSSEGVKEGGAGATTTLVFRVGIAAPAVMPVTVEYEVVEGTASAVEDFVPTSGTVVIPVGRQEERVEVVVKGDDTFEPDETVAFVVGEVQGAEVAERRVEGVIRRDEPGFSAAGGEVLEGASGTMPVLEFAVAVDRDIATGTVSVAWATEDGTALAGEDYVAGSGRIVFAPGVARVVVGVAVVGDAAAEDDESFSFVLSSPSPGTGILEGRAEGTVRDDDDGAMARAPAVARALAGFGRAAGADVVNAVWSRIADGRASYALLGGRVLQGVRSLAGLLGVGDTPEGMLRDAERYLRGGGAFLRPPSTPDLWQGTRLSFASGGGGGSFAVWASGGGGSFEGDSDGLATRGDFRAATLGVDVFSPGSGALAGLALRRSSGSVDYEMARDLEKTLRGDVELEMTSVHPYAGWTSPKGAVWGSVGYGTGEASWEASSADVAMRMAAAGARRSLGMPGHGDVALRVDGFVVGMSVEDGILSGTKADASRVRVTLEGKMREVREAGLFTGRLDLGARHDGGDGVRGGGLDAGFGFEWDSLDGGLDVSGRGSLVLAHEEESFREWALGLGVAWDPGVRGRGASLSLSPAWGTRDGGGARLDARLGYGIGVLEGRGGVEVFGEFGRERAGGSLRLGADFRSGGRDGLRAGVYGEHRRGDREVGVEAVIGF